MKVQAFHKWNKKEVLVEPVFYSWYVGMEYKALTGYEAASIFTIAGKNLIFPFKSKIMLLPVKLRYWVTMWLWMQIRHWIPNRIKRFFERLVPIKEGELPF